jgi:hypothetical protein
VETKATTTMLLWLIMTTFILKQPEDGAAPEKRKYTT